MVARIWLSGHGLQIEDLIMYSGPLISLRNSESFENRPKHIFFFVIFGSTKVHRIISKLKKEKGQYILFKVFTILVLTFFFEIAFSFENYPRLCFSLENKT